MTTQRTIKKSLITVEDMEIGEGSISQVRNGNNYTLNKFRHVYPANSLDEILALDIEKYVKATLYNGTTPLDYEYIAGTWVNVKDVEPEPDIQVFDSVFDMQQSTIEIGKIAKTKGYYTPNDGGGAEYLIVASATGVDELIDHTNANGTFSVLIASESIDIKQAGVASSQANNKERIDACSSSWAKVTGSDISFELRDSVSMSSNTYIKFNNVYTSANVAIATKNMVEMVGGVTDITIEGWTLDRKKDSFTPNLSIANLENIIYCFGAKNITIKNNKFFDPVNRHIFCDGNASNIQKNITIVNNEFTGGSRGGVSMPRYGDNIRINENEFTDVVDADYGGITFEKSISVNGSDNVFIQDNIILQTNASGATIIIEQADLTNFTNNAVISGNIIEHRGDQSLSQSNSIKAGASNNLKIINNTCLTAGTANIYIEGCIDVEIGGNFLDGAGDNAIITATDLQTGRVNSNVKIIKNTISNCNQLLNALGSTAGGISNESFGIYIRANDNNIEISDNIFTTDGCNGILMAGENYQILRNNFIGIGAVNVTIDNHFAPTLTNWVIKDNLYASTRRAGRAKVLSGNSSVVIDPDILYSFSGVVINISNLSSFNGSIAYAVANPAGSNFSILTRNSSHAGATATSDITMFWEASTEYTAKGIFGKTGI